MDIESRISTSPRYTSMKFLITCFFIVLGQGIYAFQLSMVASRTPFSGSGRQYTSSGDFTHSYVNRKAPSKSSSSATSTVISQLACMALKRRLKGHTHVSCALTTDSNALLLSGRVGPVTVKGRGWQSRLGLTCRAIEATVDECRLDIGRIITSQKLVLTTPAEGRAMVALSAIDFGNFITHPLMQPATPPVVEGIVNNKNKLEFLKDNVRIDAAIGSVTFCGMYGGMQWEFDLRRAESGKAAMITARPSSYDYGENNLKERENLDLLAVALSQTTSNFFNHMVFELDGTFLSFNDMMVTNKGKEASVMLSLAITVKKFPSPGLEF